MTPLPAGRQGFNTDCSENRFQIPHPPSVSSRTDFSKVGQGRIISFHRFSVPTLDQFFLRVGRESCLPDSE
jgi:hypothetical protein